MNKAVRALLAAGLTVLGLSAGGGVSAAVPTVQATFAANADGSVTTTFTADSEQTGQNFYCAFTINNTINGTGPVFDDEDGSIDGHISKAWTQQVLHPNGPTQADVLAEVRCYEHVANKPGDVEVSYGAHLRLPGDGSPVEGVYLEPQERGYCLPQYASQNNPQCKANIAGTITHTVAGDTIEAHYDITSGNDQIDCRTRLYREDGVQLGGVPEVTNAVNALGGLATPQELKYTLTHPFLAPGTYAVRSLCNDPIRQVEKTDTLTVEGEQASTPPAVPFGS